MLFFNKRIVYLICIFSLLTMQAISCKSTYTLVRKERLESLDKNQVLQEYAFCNCLFLGFKADSIDLSKKDGSLGVYADLSEFDINALQKIDSLTRIKVNGFKPIQLSDYKKKKAIIQNCFEFFKSKELKELIKQNK